MTLATPSAAFSNRGCHRVAECILMSAGEGLDALGVLTAFDAAIRR